MVVAGNTLVKVPRTAALEMGMNKQTLLQEIVGMGTIGMANLLLTEVETAEGVRTVGAVDVAGGVRDC